MLSFKKYIKESFLDDKSKPYEFWMRPSYRLPFPSSKPMVERIVGELKRTRALHVTNLDGLENFSKIENTAKQISVFTALRAKEEAQRMAGGVATSGGIMVDLEGQVVVLSTSDVWSSSDADGNRWFDLIKFDGRTQEGDSLLRDYHDKLTKFRNGVMDDYASDIGFDQRLECLAEAFPQNSNFALHQDLNEVAASEDFANFGPLFVQLHQGLRKWSFSYMYASDPANAEIIENFERLKKDTGQYLYAWTKEFFNLAEEIFKDWKGEFITLFVEGDQKMYNEGIMTRFTIKRIWYDFDWFDKDDIDEAAKNLKERPIPTAIRSNEWPKIYDKWLSTVGKNRDQYYLGKAQEWYD